MGGGGTCTDPETVSVRPSVSLSLSPSGAVNAASRECVCGRCASMQGI